VLVGAMAGAMVAAAATAYAPQTNFALHCMGCHLAHGEGVPGRIPDLRETFVMLSRGSAGRQYLLGVPGVAQAALDDADLAMLLNWMLTGIGQVEAVETIVRFTPEEVHRGRARPFADVAAARRRVMASMPVVGNIHR
jgi:hypothetical protein